MATLTLHDVPDDLVERRKTRANRQRRSLHNETIAALELADAMARGTKPQPAAEPVDIQATLPRMQEISAGLRARAAAEGRPVLELPPPPPITEEEKAAERERFARLRSQFKGPPLTSEEIIPAIEPESHPSELDRFGFRINQKS